MQIECQHSKIKDIFQINSKLAQINCNLAQKTDLSMKTPTNNLNSKQHNKTCKNIPRALLWETFREWSYQNLQTEDALP